MDSKELAKVRNCVEFEQVVQFVAFFGAFVGVKEGFSADALEEDLLVDGCELAARVALRLAEALLGAGLRKRRSEPSLDEVLAQVYARYALEYEAVFMELAAEDKVAVMAQLVAWLSVTARVRGWVDELGEARVDPIGREDSLFGEYFLFDDNRLYERKVKGEAEQGWRCLCWDLDSWRGFVDSRLKTLRKKKRGREKEFIEYLKEQVLPTIEAYEVERSARAHAREKQRSLAMAVANRKRSSRLETKKQRAQERAEEMKREEDEETLRKRRRVENKLRKQRDQARFERYANYEKRKIAKERQKEREQHIRRRSRRATAAVSSEPQEPEEDWWFDCQCGVYRDSDGGTSIYNDQMDGEADQDGEAVCCDRCDTWMHFRCLSDGERRRVDLTKATHQKVDSDEKLDKTDSTDEKADSVENGETRIENSKDTQAEDSNDTQAEDSNDVTQAEDSKETHKVEEDGKETQKAGDEAGGNFTGKTEQPEGELMGNVSGGANGIALPEVEWATEYATSRNEFVCDRCVAWKKQELDTARQIEEERIRQEEEMQRKAKIREEKKRAREELKRQKAAEAAEQKKKQRLLEEQMKRQEQLLHTHQQYQQQHPPTTATTATTTTTTTGPSQSYGPPAANTHTAPPTANTAATTSGSGVVNPVDFRPVSVSAGSSATTTTTTLQPAMVHHNQSVGASNAAPAAAPHHQFIPYTPGHPQPAAHHPYQATHPQYAPPPNMQQQQQQPYTQFHHYNPPPGGYAQPMQHQTNQHQTNQHQTNHGLPYQHQPQPGNGQNREARPQVPNSPTRNPLPSLSHTQPNPTYQPTHSVDNANSG